MLMLSLSTTSYQIEEIEQAGPDRYYLLTVNGRPYKIGELVYLIVDGLARQLSYQEIGSLLNTRLAEERFSATDVANVIQTNLKPLGLFDKPADAPAKSTNELLGSVFLRRRLLAFHQYEWVLRLIKWAFSPALFFSVFGLALLANVFLMRELIALEHYVTEYSTYLVSSGECGRGYQYFLFFYPVLLFILLSHEFGHAAASYRFGVKPKEIGVGLYLIFPVLYAEVTDIWRLSKMKRMIVNMGGLYVQLLINLVLIWFLVSNFGNYDRVNTARYLIQLNVAMLVINTIPFIKLDGYWLYSDFFSLPNLHRQTSACLLRGVAWLFPKFASNMPAMPSINTKNPFLILYTIGRYLFLIAFLFWGLDFVAEQVGTYPTQIKALVGDCTLCTVEPFLKTSLTLTFVGFTAVRYLKPSYAWVQQKWFSKG